MEKPFLEVFPGLNIADELKELLKLVVVEKVTMTKDRSSIRVYIRSPRLIHKKNIYALEAGIAKQLFPGRPITIKILEKYRLSAQYTPEKLYDVYRDSILMELKNYGMIEYNILRRADTKFVTDDKMVMTIEDNLIYRERSKEVGRVLEKIFTERCGLAAEVEFLYKESEKKDPMDQPVFMKPGGELVVGVQSEENYLEGAAESAPWDEGTSNGGFNGTFGDGNGNADVQMAAQSAAGSGASGGRSGAERAVPAQRHRPVLELQSRRRTRLERAAETRLESPRAADRTETAADSRRRPSERREKVDSPAVSGKAPTEGSRTESRRTRMFFSGAILRAMR